MDHLCGDINIQIASYLSIYDTLLFTTTTKHVIENNIDRKNIIKVLSSKKCNAILTNMGQFMDYDTMKEDLMEGGGDLAAPWYIKTRADCREFFTDYITTIGIDLLCRSNICCNETHCSGAKKWYEARRCFSRSLEHVVGEPALYRIHKIYRCRMHGPVKNTIMNSLFLRALIY